MFFFYYLFEYFKYRLLSWNSIYIIDAAMIAKEFFYITLMYINNII